jgi:phosphoribosylglycinamide formyltransferase 1
MAVRKRVAILISGRGSNMAALIEAARQPAYPAEIALVVSNRPDAGGLERARAEGVSTVVVDHKAYPDRESFDAALDRVLREHDIELVCLAGFMRILTPAFVEGWTGRMLNIHPSLLPEFKGTDTHARALAAGVAKHGCSVHFVTPELDAGPVITQVEVPVFQDDTPETLAERVLEQEHYLYPLALAMVAARDAVRRRAPPPRAPRPRDPKVPREPVRRPVPLPPPRPRIASFADARLKQLYDEDDPGSLPKDMVRRIAIVLAALDEAETVGELERPTFRLSRLEEKGRELWSIAVAGDRRIVFALEDREVRDVRLSGRR